MRGAGVEVFEYVSARDPQQGLYVGLFALQAFAQTHPKQTQAWLCELRAQVVRFKSISQNQIVRFPLNLFLVDDTLPQPA